MTKMLDAGESAEVTVSWLDQNNINTFSRLNNRMSDYEDKLEQLVKDKEYLDDLTTELELMDEDDEEVCLRYKIGGAWVRLSLDQIKDRLESDLATATSSIASIKSNMDSCTVDMDKLKVTLYGKFGKSINLER